MAAIINKTTKEVQMQSHRTKNWMGDGWADIPDNLIGTAIQSAGFCELVFDDDGHLIDIIPTERLTETKIPSPQEDTAALLIDQEYRITLLELGVTEHAV